MNIEPFETSAQKRQYVLRMFAATAGHYDRMNRVLSLGRDTAWRRELVEEAGVSDDSVVLDVAVGTGDVALLLAERVRVGRVIGLDFSHAMLAHAADKLRRAGARQISLIQGDGLRLPFADGAFDAVTSAFSLRNVTDVASLFAEMRRVLRPAGRMACLEISKPARPVVRRLFGLYFDGVVPVLGRILTRNGQAYAYLPDSLNRFLASEQVIALLRAVGFREADCKQLMLGTVTIYTGLK